MYKFDKMMEKYEQELEAIQTKITSGAEISDKDLDRSDKLSHTLKSLVCYCEKKEEMETIADPGMSGRRGRAANGQYVSRDMSYDDGMSGRYSYRGYPPDYGYGNGMPPRW